MLYCHPPMKPTQDYSYGVIPLYKQNDQWQVLLIHQYGSKGDVYWGFPKGYAEEGENGPKAAMRELMEETGLVVSDLETDHPFAQQYSFIHDGTTIEKTVTYYIGYPNKTEYTLQTEELADAKWCTLADARALLTHDGTKQMFDEVVAFVEECD